VNYQHLYYFWSVVRFGGVGRAAERLKLRPHSISAQLRRFQRDEGVELLLKSGRQLALTPAGNRALRYADEIFRLGGDLKAEWDGHGPARRRLVVGVAESFPKLVSVRLLAPLLDGPEPLQLICEEERAEALLARLAVQELDVLLTDAPAPPTVRVKAFSHKLGECAVAVLAVPSLAARLKKGFPQSLSEAPAWLPTEGTALRRNLDDWARSAGSRLSTRAECSDSALMKAFAAQGGGWVPVPALAQAEACRQYRLTPVGLLPRVRESFYALTLERRVEHPGVQALLRQARSALKP
jgi:LysR family transcriptional regulator, transcriptional activator of nhaA